MVSLPRWRQCWVRDAPNVSWRFSCFTITDAWTSWEEFPVQTCPRCSTGRKILSRSCGRTWRVLVQGRCLAFRQRYGLSQRGQGIYYPMVVLIRDKTEDCRFWKTCTMAMINFLEKKIYRICYICASYSQKMLRIWGGVLKLFSIASLMFVSATPRRCRGYGVRLSPLFAERATWWIQNGRRWGTSKFYTIIWPSRRRAKATYYLRALYHVCTYMYIVYMLIAMVQEKRFTTSNCCGGWRLSLHVLKLIRSLVCPHIRW